MYRDIDFAEKENKRNKYLIGIFFYGQALPMALMSTLVFFTKYRHVLAGNSDQGNYQTVQADMNWYLRIFNEREYDASLGMDAHSWRMKVVYLGNILPSVLLSVDFIFNKIRIPFR